MRKRGLKISSVLIMASVLATGTIPAAAAAPAAPTVKYLDHTTFGGKSSNKQLAVEIVDKKAEADGIQADLYDKKGKKLETMTWFFSANEKTRKASFFFKKTDTKNVFRVVVKAYKENAQTGEKVFGRASVFRAAPQPVVTNVDKGFLKKGMVKDHSIKLKWKKVNGASNYVIYVAKSKKWYALNSKKYKKLKWKKVKTVSGKKTSCTIRKMGKSRISTKKNFYYIKVVTAGKNGKQTYQSPDEYSVNAHKYY